MSCPKKVTNLRVCFENVVDFSDANPILRTPGRSFVQVSDGGTILGTMSKRFPVDFLAINGLNISESGVVRVELFSDINQLGTKVYDSHFQSGWILGESGGFYGWDRVHWVKYIGTVVYCRSFRVTIYNQGNPTNVERLFFGEYFIPRFNPAYGPSLRPMDTGSSLQVESGSTYAESGEGFREFDFDINFIDRDEQGFWFNNFSKNRLSRDFFVTLFPERWDNVERDYTMLARLKNFPSPIHSAYSNWAVKLECKEI